MSALDLHHGDCLEVLRRMPDACIDAVVTDPPYGLSFMGKRWDYDVPSVEVWAECLRVLKPGGHLLAFAGTRTQHRMAVRIEDAGFEIRDMIAWVYGSGFPKSLDVSKAIDKAAGAEREVVGENPNHRPVSGVAYDGVYQGGNTGGANITAPATDAARQWQGWGTALKPALEPITVARKRLAGTVAENVQRFGTGALNVDGCRVGDGADKGIWPVTQRRHDDVAWTVQPVETDTNKGRWPANLIHDGSDEVLAAFPQTKSGALNAGHAQGAGMFGKVGGDEILRDYGGDSGSAARFFYCAKASKRDRDEGLDGFEEKYSSRDNGFSDKLSDTKAPRANHHPTVKPTDLMRYLCRLVTPPGGVVLDPFTGSGSTGKAAILEGFRFVGIEREAEYVEIARARILAATSPIFSKGAA
jgi:site-specific DNA-methyltransferase (adenine-specific)